MTLLMTGQSTAADDTLLASSFKIVRARRQASGRWKTSLSRYRYVGPSLCAVHDFLIALMSGHMRSDLAEHRFEFHPPRAMV